MLRRILKRAKLWHTMADDVKPLREPRSIGRALTEDQREKLIQTAAGNPDWENAYYAAVLALNTTMRRCEVSDLTWGATDLERRVLTVRKSKTEAGERVIPLTDEAYAAVLRLRERAETFGSIEHAHYLFASFRAVGKFNGNDMLGNRVAGYDPSRPVKSWRKAWRKLTAELGLKGLRFHDLHHHALTELAESGASEQTILAIAGHVSRRMLERYSHIRLEAKRSALEALSRRSKEGYGTNGGTKSVEVDSVPPQMLEIW